MGLTSRRRTRIAWAVLALAVIALLVDGTAWWRASRRNAAIAGAAVLSSNNADDAAPELRFAEAHAQAASGATEAALNHYRALQGDSKLGQAARFNSANLLLRQAVEIRNGPQPGQAIALIELAKETYRDVLRADPQHWPARYNLERAQRLLADPEESDADPPDAAHNRERAATTMRGYSPGLP